MIAPTIPSTMPNTRRPMPVVLFIVPPSRYLLVAASAERMG